MTGGALFTCKEEFLIEVFNPIYLFIANNQNFSNVLLENVNNVIPNPELTTPSKEATKITAHPTHSKPPINDSSADISERLTNQLQQQVLILQTELRNKDFITSKAYQYKCRGRAILFTLSKTKFEKHFSASKETVNN